MKIFSVIAAVVFLAGCVSSGPKDNQVCFESKCFKVEIVQDDKSRSKGLMFRQSLDADQGMLFVFPKVALYSFWMKNTLIPLDMIWMDHSRRIVHIETDVPPCKEDPCPLYSPKGEALYVLEVNAGQAEKLGLRTGQFADFRLVDQ